MTKATNQNGLINEYLKINESIVNLLIVALVGVHTIAFLFLGYALVCKFLFIPFSSHQDFIYYIGLSISNLPLSTFSIYLCISIISYLLVFGFISVMVGIYQKIKLLNENIIEIAHGVNINIMESRMSEDGRRIASRFRDSR